jgi:hypothetical protein
VTGIRRSGLWRLIQFFIELAQDQGYAKVTVTVQKGQISVVHVDRTYTLDTLPIRDTRGHDGRQAVDTLTPPPQRRPDTGMDR